MAARSLLLAPLVAAALLVAEHRAAAAQAPAASPCADSLYQSLRGKALEQLTAREYEYFVQRDRACTDHQRLQALIDQPRAAAPASPRDLRYTVEASTQANPMGGVDILLRNTTGQPVIVNSVEVYDCVNIRLDSCRMHHPKVRIAPGQQRRVLTIRYSSLVSQHHYRYRYFLSGAES